MSVSTIKVGQGRLGPLLRVDPGVDVGVPIPQPRPPVERPDTGYGQQGVVVRMKPIQGLTPKGVFAKNKPFVFQAPPWDVFGEDGAFSFNDYATVAAGQHSDELGRDLRTVSFETIFVDWTPHWAVLKKEGWLPDARALCAELCRIRDKGKPFHLLAHQSGASDYDVDYAATLRSVRWEVRAGEVDAYYVTVAFSEFSMPTIKRFLAATSNNRHLPATLTTAKMPANRNTLAKLAKYYYGDPSQWRLIAAANGINNLTANSIITGKNTGHTKITVPARR